jgi:hypothetical protein
VTAKRSKSVSDHYSRVSSAATGMSLLAAKIRPKEAMAWLEYSDQAGIEAGVGISRATGTRAAKRGHYLCIGPACGDKAVHQDLVVA